MNNKVRTALRIAFVIWILSAISGCGNHLAPDTAPDWAQIKAQTALVVALPNEYGTPYPQLHSTLAWEDGTYISRDGLHLYTTFVPADVYQFVQHMARHPACPDITPFLRGPQLGMDLIANPWGCEGMLHSDIAYTSRTSTDEPFGPWQLSNLATPYRWDGGFQALENSDGTIDAVLSISTDERGSDIFWARGVSRNPPLLAFIPMPPPINTTGADDNPHLERLDAHTLVLLLDNHGVGDAATTIKYALSTDNGAMWSPPVELGETINAGPHDMHGHLYHDGADWWLYFASERQGAMAIYRARHGNSPRIQRDFDHWQAAEWQNG